MSTFVVLILLIAACCLFAPHRAAWRVRSPWHPWRGRRVAERNRQPPPESLPRLVRQVASLLAAGRTGSILWGELAYVLAAEQNRVQDQGTRPSGSSPRMMRSQLGQMAATGQRIEPVSSADATLLLVLAVQRSSVLGLPAAAAVRHACGAAPLASRGGSSRQSGSILTLEQHRMWHDLAACLQVCEASGAPIAAVLGRLAATIEADQDAIALRETALAGPRATVRLLSWLPFIGFGLGVVMGVDPLTALLGSPLGWTVLATGVGFAGAGRVWSAKMISEAARPAHLPSHRESAPGAGMRISSSRWRS